MRALALLLLLSGCPKFAPVSDAAPVASSVPAASSSATKKVVAAPQVLTDVAGVVKAWNEATNAHDDTKLGAIYADTVELYGSKLSREKAVAIKKAAFAKHDRDDLGAITVAKNRATFQKKSKSKDGKVIEVTGYIDIDPSLKITAEGDTTTDTNLARKKETDCMTAVVSFLESTKEGKAAAAANPGRGIERPDPVKSPHYWTVEYFGLDARTNELVSNAKFEVYDDRAEITVPDPFNPWAVTVDPALGAKLRAACP